MGTNIVVGLDGSSSAKAALLWATGVAARTGGSVRAVHVWHVEAPEGYVPVDELRHNRELAARADACRWFEEAAGEACRSTPCIVEAVEGVAPGPRLVALAEHAQLLVVGAPEHRGLGRLLHGSVGHYVLSHSSCPVVFVPSDTYAARREHPDERRSGVTVSP